jgi:glutamate/tyrosine decarboxylase-like PLP-dependent enzyme
LSSFIRRDRTRNDDDVIRDPVTALDLASTDRAAVWDIVRAALDEYTSDIRSLPITPSCDADAVERVLAELNPDSPVGVEDALKRVIAALRTQQLHATHPGYFGLFVPPPATIGVAAETLAAGFNPQLASWGHSPFGVQAEQWVIRTLAERVGFAPSASQADIDIASYT